jgi:hypothetical protein
LFTKFSETPLPEPAVGFFIYLTAGGISDKMKEQL